MFSSFTRPRPCAAVFVASLICVLAAPAFADRESRFGGETPAASQDTPPRDDNVPHGLGITLQTEGEQSTIVALWGKSPLVAAGVRAGDIITHVDGAPIRGQTIEQIAGRLRGPKGSTLRITVTRKGAPREIVVARTIRLQGGTWNDLLRGLKPMPDPAQAQALPDPRRSARDLDRGRAALDAGKLREALDHLERAVAAAPDNAQARLRLAEAYIASGRGEDALKVLLDAKNETSSGELAAEKSAIERGLAIEIAARDGNPAIDQAERIRRQSDARACIMAPDLDCMATHALNAAYGRGSLNDRVRALVRLAPILARAGRRDAAFRLLEEAAALARTAQPEPGFMIRPAQVRISELLAHVALGFRAAGDETAAARLADDAIETALVAGAMRQNDGGPGLSAEQVRSNAVNDVANIFAREGYRDGAERALSRAIDLSNTLLRRHWDGSNDGLYTGCGSANVQSLAWVRARYATTAESVDVLGTRHSCRYWLAKYGAGQFISSRRYIEAVEMSGILIPVPAKAAVWAELAAKLAEDGLYVEAQSTGSQAWALYNSATDATIGGRTFLEFSPSSDYASAVEKIARAGLIEQTERAAARLPAILRADPSNSYLDAAGIEKRVAESRARQARNLVKALVEMGGRANMEKARSFAATLSAVADDWTRNSMFADLIAGEFRIGSFDAALQLIAAHPKAARDNSWRLVQEAVMAGRPDLAEKIADKETAGNLVESALIRAGMWDEAIARNPHAGMATRAMESWLANPKFDLRTYGFDYLMESLADIRKAKAAPFRATPATAGIAFRHAFALASANYHHGATELFRAGLAAEPGNGPGHFYLAESLFRLGRHDEARESYEQAKKLAAAGDEGRLAGEALANYSSRVERHKIESEQAKRRNADLAAALAAAQKQKASLEGGAAEQARAAEEERRNAEMNKKIRQDSLKYMASFSLNSLGYYDGTKYVEKLLAKDDVAFSDHAGSPVFRQALAAWQKARGLPADGELSLDTAEKIEGEMHKLLTWGAACFRQPPSNLDSAKRGDPIMRSLIMAQALIAKRGCEQGERMNASSCQVCAAPPPELPPPGHSPLFVEK